MTAPESGVCCEIVKLHIARSRRHIDDEHIERTAVTCPVGLAKHLVQRRDDHGAAPDDRRSLIDHEPHGHDLEAPAFQRLDTLALPDARLSGDAEQARLRGTIDVGIDDPDPQAQRLKAQRKINRGRRLADAALARGDRDDVLDARNALDLAGRAAGLGGLAGAGAIACGAARAGVLHALVLLEARYTATLRLRLCRARCRIGCENGGDTATRP